MAKKLFIDIETLPPREEDRNRLNSVMAKILARHKAKNSWRDDEDDVSIEVEDPFRELSLQGEFGRLLTIGIILEEDGQLIHHGLYGRDPNTKKFHLDEQRILKPFWHLVETLNLRHDIIIGHNILDFDLPFILKRSIIHKIKPSVRIPFKRYQSHPIFDVMWEWSSWRRKVSLNEIALALNLCSPKAQGIDGSQIYQAWRDGRDEDIASYCMRDVECTREIYYRLNFETSPFLTKYEEKISIEPASDSWLRD
ncbi:MAG TPA: ribonuclease H-like domain-containing protein [Blastocatellia bacterium]|nr:ribonuclease H-like domain-containing protein [Blastocatellia bacterium]